MKKYYRIVKNLADHVGYEGELVKIVKEEKDDFFIVQNEKGKTWTCGIEELEVEIIIPQPIWEKISNEYVNEGFCHIDAWVTNKGNEEGKVIAKVNVETGKVTYLDSRAKTDKNAQEAINEAILYQTKKGLEEKYYRIVENVDDHVGYKGETVKIVKKQKDDFYIVQNEQGKQWTCGIEELEEVPAAKSKAAKRTYEVIGYANQRDYDNRIRGASEQGITVKREAMKLGRRFLNEYHVVKVQSNDREFIAILDKKVKPASFTFHLGNVQVKTNNINELREYVEEIGEKIGVDEEYCKYINDFVFDVQQTYQTYHGLNQDDWGMVHQGVRNMND